MINAIKYAHRDRESFAVTISGKLTKERIIIEFEDCGIGIDPSHFEKVFEKGYRISTAQHRAEGEGLGLYFVRKLLRSYDGSIEIKKGHYPTTFQIVLPRNLVVTPYEGIG